MGKLAALLFAVVTGSHLPPPDPPPKPKPAPAPVPRSEPYEFICVQMDPDPPQMCEDTFPRLPWHLSFLRPCPDWIAKIVAEADAL